MEAIVNADLCHSTILSEVHPGVDVFAPFHAAVRRAFDVPWSEGGDGVVAVFSDLSSAVRGALHFQEALVEENAKLPDSKTPLFARVGIHVNRQQQSLLAIPPPERGKAMNPDLSLAGHLQKKWCPTGRIAISKEAYGGIGKHLEELFRPTPSGQFFLQKQRSLMPQEMPFAAHLSDEQQRALPALSFLHWDLIKQGEMTLATLSRILDEPLVVVYGDSSSDRGPVLHSAATSDAIAMTELARYARQDVAAGIDQWEDTADLVSTRTALIVGSGTSNMYANALNSVFWPLRFAPAEKGRIHGEIVANDGKSQETYYGRHGSPRGIREHCGLVLVSKSVFNIEKSLVWIAGTTGMGTQAAMAFLRDVLLNKPLAALDPRAIGAVVTPHVATGRVGEYFKRWRIADYRLLHQIDAEGHSLGL